MKATRIKTTDTVVNQEDLQKAFDKGWTDGYGGEPSHSAHQASSLTDAYRRGYRLGIGKQDRNRAEQLLKKMEVQKRLQNMYRDSQSEMER